jgi:hypothetical protein
MKADRFFSAFVRIQQDRGHPGVDAGPYKFSLRKYPRFRRSHLARDFSCEERKIFLHGPSCLHPSQNKKGAKYTGKLSCIPRLLRLKSKN